MLRKHRILIGIALCLPAMAGVKPIGMATSSADMEIGRARMPGPATLYEGAVVETGAAPVRLSLANGAKVTLGSGAKATVHLNSLLLERGTGQIDARGDFAVRARSITVVPTSHPSRARMELSSDGALQVAALSGNFEIRTAGATSPMAAGRSLSFAADAAEAGAAAPSKFKGCLAKSDKGYLLEDEKSKKIVALRGSSIDAKAGDRVTVVGRPDPSARQTIQVLRLTVDGHGCSAASVLAAAGAAGAGAAGAGAAGAGAAAGVGAATAGAAGAAAGIGATTIAVVGVAAASAVVIPTVALTSDSGSSTTNISPSSR